MTSTGARAKLCLLFLPLLACQPGQAGNAPVTRANHKFPISTGPHAVDCNTCHGAFASFSQFTCFNCHGHEQPLTDMLHVSLTSGTPSLPDGGMAYAYDSVSCLQCHASGDRVPYDHTGITASCASCHASDAPFVALPVAGVGLDGGAFTHPPVGTNDCGACHTTTTWLGAGNAPTDLIHDAAQDITVAALVPSYAGTSISRLTPQTETLSMSMNHQTTDLAAGILGGCANCHDTSTGTYFPGALHSSLANSVPVLAQPALCMDCHASSMPLGFVGPTDLARSPASGAMKHDAVVWNSAGPTKTSAVPYDCAVCHQPPSKALTATWAMNAAGTTPALFHASLTAAGQPQPTSCLDCHANSRPNAILTSSNSSMAPNLAFDHGAGPALGDCASCHVNQAATATQWTSWSQAKFHLAGSSNPTTCLPCHTGERPVSNAGWVSTTYQNSPFDYGTNASGITHGDGQDCAACHRGPGTGVWGSTQNWVNGVFTHGPTTISGTTCIACHLSQRPTSPVGPAGTTPFDHSLNGTGDCLGCHQATVAAGTYVKYLPLPGGDWKGGIGYPGSTLVGSPNQFITVTQASLNRSGTLVTGTSSISATFYNMMLHVSTVLPAALNAGPTSAPDYTKCWHCHTNTSGTVTSYADGKYHSALTSYSATPGGAVTPFPQPTSQCNDCHAQMRPSGIVMKAGSDLQPMDHNAMFTAPATIGGVSVSGAAAMDCSSCHRNPGVTWADGLPAQAPLFHANIGAAAPQDCNVCHFPLMADAPKADLTNGTRYSMKHRSAQITFQNCKTCHATALSKAATTPIAATLWQTGAYHAALSSQPGACMDCHSNTDPAPNASTQSSWVYTLAMGATATNQAQWMNHGSSTVAGKDCVVCHAADAKASGSAWSKADYFHGPVANPATCKECHGLTNGGGSVAGTKNNLPAGLTNSSKLTTASAATGIPAGTHDQITHADVNVSARDCNFCHTQAGISTVAGVKGQEWAQASFHVKFTSANPLVMNGTTGRCSSCHMNVKPGATFTAFDHSAFSATSGSQDCSSCHSWPGTGTASTPNWLGAGAMPMYISVGGFAIKQPPAATPTTQLGINNLPHPAVGTGVACTACHAMAAGGKSAIGYDHLSPLINPNCSSCHEAGTNLIGTIWNGATTVAAGAGDSRPYTLPGVSNSKYPNHFYPVDCYQCHIVPAGNGYVTTGTAYTTAWHFPHTTKKMTNPSTCVMCHTKGIP